MKDIKFLDCTYRDGAHVVAGEFKKQCIVDGVRKLTEAKVDIIEFGFLKMCDYDTNKIYYPHIEDAYGVLEEVEDGLEKNYDTIYALMARADEYDISELSPCSGSIRLIRVAFYFDYLNGGIEFARKAMEKGYICSLNLINTPGSTLEELRQFIVCANELNPYAVSIVDTFGVLEIKELESIIKLYDEELNESIRIGLHVHENLSLSYALAQHFLNVTRTDRNVIVDGSLMGIGRAPGNLCTELIAGYLNSNYEKNINISIIMEAIERNIKSFRNHFKWGYAPEFVLSARYKLHRSYAEYLEKKGYDLDEIESVLRHISDDHKKKYDEKYIKGLVEKIENTDSNNEKNELEKNSEMKNKFENILNSSYPSYPKTRPIKAVILANSNKYHFINGECIPTCFLSLHGGLTILQRTFSLLSVSGFSQNDICVVFGSGGVWDTESARTGVHEISAKKIFTKETDVLNAKMFDDPFFTGADILVIDGSDIIDLAIITRLLRYKEKDVLVIKDMLSPDDSEKLISTQDNMVKAIVDAKSAEYPWVGYAGVCKLSSKFVKIINNKLVIPLSLLEAISLSLKDRELKVVNYDDLGYGIIKRGHSNELIGGSYSKLNYRLVVRKEADNAGRDKLINEIKWLLSIPEDLKPYFSSVLEYDIESPKVYYNVPYYGSRNLREYIFTGNFDTEDTIVFLDNLLHWMFKNVYSRKISKAPKSWTMEKHIKRVLDRLVECCDRSKYLQKLITADKIVINGEEYNNIKGLYEKIANIDAFIERVNPKDLVMIHGDLHFQNILLSSETDSGFILVDPRGEHNGSDVYYDLGKIFHSIHGKYDFIHSDQFRLKVKFDDAYPLAEYEFTNEYMIKVYDGIYDRLLELLPSFDYIKNDPDWQMKCLWAEASHFCSVMTFHIEKSKKPDRVILLYLTGVKLINEFYNKYVEGKY